MSAHECPAPGCTKQIDSTQLCCPAHWYQLPQGLRNRIWAEYRKQPLSPGHIAAITEAVEYLSARA